MKALLLGLTLAGVGAAGFVAGRVSAPPAPTITHTAVPRALRVQAQAAPQAPDDPRELIPLVPGPGEGSGGQQPGQQPGQGPQQPQQGQGECPVLLLKDGQLYQIQPNGPGQGQPGQQPGQGGGQGGQGGQDGGELFPLEPYRGPSPIPGIPSVPGTPDTPDTPDTPTTPRTQNI